MARPTNPEKGNRPLLMLAQETTGRSLISIDKKSCADYVYIVHCAESNFYKIGVSTKPPMARLAQLQCACPYRLTMIHVFVDPSAKSLERQFHKQLQSKRVRGEWFQLNESELLSLVSALAEAIGAERPIMRLVA